jgi:putative transposase
MLDLVATAQASADALPVTRVCQTLGLSRATYYRWLLAEPQPDRDMELRAHIQEIALEMSTYGYRRVTHELRRRGVPVNHTCVLRLLRADNLLCLRKRAFVQTTMCLTGCLTSRVHSMWQPMKPWRMQSRLPQY